MWGEGLERLRDVAEEAERASNEPTAKSRRRGSSR